MTSGDMLRILTQKFKCQSLNEVQPFQQKLDDDHDSGTESDDENLELEEITKDLDDGCHHDTSSYGSASPHPSSPIGGPLMAGLDSAGTHEISEHNLDSISCTSDFERSSWDFDRHSSEEELNIINKDGVAEKRKWSQVNRNSCDSGGSSDDEVRDYMLQPQPVLFSSSPPRGVQKIKNQAPPQSSPKLFLARVTPVTLKSVSSVISPRKRHRQTSTSDSPTESEQESVIQRPCLNFEKMQKTIVKKQCTHNIGRAKIVKIRTVNGSSRTPKCLFDPSVFSFRSISTAYSPLTPVEEPSCAY